MVSPASFVRRLTFDSAKCSGIQMQPLRTRGLTFTLATTDPRRETTRTSSPSAILRRAASLRCISMKFPAWRIEAPALRVVMVPAL
jgi:hypothetical protein